MSKRMPYAPTITLKLLRAEAITLRAHISSPIVLTDLRKTNPALARVFDDLVAQLENELVEHHRPDHNAVLERAWQEVTEFDVIGIPKDIVLRLRRDFAKRDQANAVNLLRELQKPRLMRCGLQISNGDMDRLAAAVETKKTEDRDLMLAAEYDRFHVQLFDFSRPFEESAIEKG